MKMRIPVVSGVIERRLLVNFRADPDVVSAVLPAPFRPKCHRGEAIVGICLIRLKDMRPNGIPAVLGMSSENAAHRFAVEWEADGTTHEGVYIPRRDTNSILSRLAGGRLFPGEHHAAEFQVEDDGQTVDFTMRSCDGEVSVRVRGREASGLPKESIFASPGEASDFFEGGALGYSATHRGDRLDGLLLHTPSWEVRPFEVAEVHSSYFEDASRFPPGTVRFDHALVMRNIQHEWREAEGLPAASTL